MARDYIPTSLHNFVAWATNLKARIGADGPALGQTPAQVTSDQALVDSMLTPATDALTKQNAAMEAEGTARAAIGTNEPLTRDMLNRYKATTNWNEGHAEAWAVKSLTTHYNMDIHHPTITALARVGSVEIRGKKPGFTSLSIQMRLAGTADWTTIGMKLNHLPFYDTTAPQVPGKPEKREYQGLGYVGDVQTGPPSDIVSAVWS